MELKIRYENEMQTIVLNDQETEQLWISLSIEDEGLSQQEREQRIQEVWEEKMNKPEYNIWHRETRHIDPTPKRKRMDGRRGYIQGDPDDAAFDIMDYLLTTPGPDTHAGTDEYEEVCSWVRQVLQKKPDWAEAFIAVCLDGEEETAYARRIGDTQSNVAHKLARAKKKLQENLVNRHK